MSKEEFLKQQFVTLRGEIDACKNRTFWILIVGVFLILFAAYQATVEPKIFANAAIPLIIIVLILSFADQQNSIIRAGRYIREKIEPAIDEVTGWEVWLESNRSYREVDRFFFGGFILVFLAFYLISCTLSLYQLNDLPSTLLAKCAAVTYGMGFLCVAIVLIRHWHSCTSTT